MTSADAAANQSLALVLQRLVEAVSYVVFYLLAIRPSISQAMSICLLAALSLLGCEEKLCSVANLVSVERDWVAEGASRPILTGDSDIYAR